MSAAKPTITIARTSAPNGRGRFGWNVWWDDGDDTGHGIGGWTLTRIGARFEAWRATR